MTKPEDLTNNIVKHLQTYTNEVSEQVETLAKNVSKKYANQLKSTSPKDSGAYAQGWTFRVVDGAYVIANMSKGSISHLLENGYAKVGGGRVNGRAHIAPAEQDAIEEFEKGVERVIRG